MAGGTFTTQDKVRPGVYINFNNESRASGAMGERGVVAMALALSWGRSKEIIQIEAGQDVQDILGYDVTDDKLLLVREALKRAKTLLLYRLNAGTKATAAHEGLTITAKHGGVRGNDIKITVQANVDDPEQFEVKTWFASREVDVQFVADIEGLHGNDWVDFSGTGSLDAAAGVSLTGGTDGTVTNGDHADYLAAVELQEFQTIALTEDEASLKALYVSFVKRLRDDEGKKIQAVVSDYASADYEGVINIKNGVILSDGTPLTAAQACAWVAGATAAANVNESLTYQAYDDAVDANPRYTSGQITAALLAGEFVFTANNGRSIVEQDINSLTSYTLDKGKLFAKNRVIRVLDGIANDIKRIVESFYIGKVDNNSDGRNLLRNECNSYFTALQGMGAVQNFDAQNDVIVQAGNDSDSVYVEVHAQPVDAVEKIYMKVWVK